MPGIQNDYGHFYDFLTPFQIYQEGVLTTVDPNTADVIIDLRKSTSAMQNKIVIVLTAANPNATATIKLYLKTANTSSISNKWILAAVSTNAKIDELISFNDLYAGDYVISLEDITSGPIDVHVSYSDHQAQYPLD